MNDLVEFLQDLSMQGVALWLDGDSLRYGTMSGVLTPELLNRIKQHKAEIIQLLRQGADISKSYPLSIGQKALWFLSELEPSSSAYNMGMSLRICSHLDVVALKRAWLALVAAHPMLRTTFTKIEGTPRQKIHGLAAVDFEQIDAANWTNDELKKRVREAYNRPFDLGMGVSRVIIFTRSPKEHILLINIHHIAGDGWSIWMLLSELGLLYRGEITNTAPELPLSKTQYPDYINWQLQLLESSKGEELWNYWQKQLAGKLPVINLPTDRPRPPVQTFNGNFHFFPVREELSKKLRELALAEGATLYMVLLAAFFVLLHRYSGQSDICIGSPTSGRSKSEWGGIFGYFANSVVLRGNLSGNPEFKEFLQQVRQIVLGAMDRQDYPFALLVEKLQPQRDPSYSPIFQVGFAVQKPQRQFAEFVELLNPEGNVTPIDWGGLSVEPFTRAIQEGGQFDLTLHVFETSGQLVGAFNYNTDLFDDSTIGRMARHFQVLLEGIVANPKQHIQQLPLLTEVERQGLDNSEVYVLDTHRQLVPLGVEGEIYLNASHLREDDSKELLWHPKLGCLWKTGEWGRRQGDGSLERLGFVNRLAWITGQRVNLQEVERALRSTQGVEDCHVLVRQNQLVAYLVVSKALSGQSIHARIKSQLPSYMQPSAYVPVSALPLTELGEIDEKALGHLEVIDSDLITAWEEKLISHSEIEQLAVVVEPKEAQPPSRVHLSDLVPQESVAENLSLALVQMVASSSTGIRTEPENLGLTPENLASMVPALSDGGPLIMSEDAPQTLTDALQKAAEKYPDKGLIYINADGSELNQSYSELLQEAQKILAGLRKLGLKPQDKVIFQFNQNQDFISAFWGCMLGGFIPVPVSIARSYDQPNNTIGQLQNSWQMLGRPLVLTDSQLAAKIQKWSRGLNLENFEVETLERLQKCSPDREWHDSKPEDLAILLLTSGSTGMPKAVKQTHRSLLSRCAATAQMNGFTFEDISLNWFPLDHVGGIVMFHLRDVYLGCQQIHAPTEMVLQAPTKWLDWISQYGVTITWAPNFAYGLVIEQIERLLKLGEKAGSKWNLSSLKFILNAGEAIVAKTARRFLELLIPHQLPAQAMHPAWGMSETSSAVTFSDKFLLELTTNEQQFVEVGDPIPGTKIRIADNQNKLVAEGKIGSIQIQGVSLASGYYQNPVATQEAFTEDGWFNTGDLGFIKAGRLTITGRQKDVIIINGVNYYSHEIEAVVEELEGIEVSYTAACAIRDHGEDTDRLAIFFTPEKKDEHGWGSLLKEIRSVVVNHIGINPDYLIPVDKTIIPKTAIGKIQRPQLKQRFEGGEFDKLLKRVDILLENNKTIPNWFYSQVWRSKEAVSFNNANQKGLTLIFVDRLGLGNLLSARLEKYHQPCIRVDLGSDFAQTSAKHYTIVPGNPQHYRQLLESLTVAEKQISQIIHLGHYQEYAGEISDLETLERSQELGLYSLLHLVQALAQVQGTRNPVQLLFVASHSQLVQETDIIAYEKATALGLLKTIPQEMPWISCRHIDLPIADVKVNGNYIWQELCTLSPELEIAYRDGKRLVSGLEAVNLAEEPKQGLPFQPEGIYLLSGGLGGIGLEIAKYLLEHQKARLILVGITPLPELTTNSESVEGDEMLLAKMQALQQLHSLPGEVIYHAVDICDLEQLQQLVNQTVSQWGGQLDGVIHLAGMLHEQELLSETQESIATQLKAKVSGTWVLERLLQNNADGLFIHFASVNGFLGGINVGAYAAANSFQQAFSNYQTYQTNRKSYCLNWSMWNETGMSRGYQMKELSRQKGYYAITPTQGIYSLLGVLCSTHHHLLIGLDESKSLMQQLMGACQSKQQLTAYFTASTPDLDISGWSDLVVSDCFGTPTHCDGIQLEEMSLTETGDVDREQLASSQLKLIHSGEYIPPQTPTQQLLANIFSEVLGVGGVGIQDNFFELGGHSLLATQLISRVRQTFELEVPLRTLFEFPTVAELDRALSQLRQKDNQLTIPSLEAIPRDGQPLPLSWAQERLWFLYQLEGESATYNIPGAVRITGHLNPNALENAVREIIRRHEVFRTRFPSVNGTPRQVIESVDFFCLKREDWQHLSPSQQEIKLREYRKLQLEIPFNLATGPVWRISLLELSTTESILLMTMHHIIFDGWSIGIFLQELSSLYQAYSQGEPSPLPELSIQYADYSQWQRNWFSGEVRLHQLDYWQKQLADAPELLQLPTDKPRPPVPTYFGKIQTFTINPELTDQLQQLSQKMGTTLFMTLLATFAILLYRYSSEKDILIGTPIANRTRAEIEPLIGFFVNTLVLRTKFKSDRTFRELLSQVREVSLQAYAHQDVPFEQVVEALQPERNLSHSPLFQVMFVLQNAPQQPVELSGVTLTPFPQENIPTQFDLTLSMEQTDSGLAGSWEYATDLFAGETIARMTGHFQTLLEGIVANPDQKVGQLPLLTPAESHQLLVEWNDTEREYPKDKCIHQLFEERVERTPDAVAVVFEGEQLTYSQLNSSANQLARYLQSMGVEPEVLVGICVERSLEMVVGLLGILKAGGAYVPLDPAYPTDRLAYMLEDSSVRVLLTQKRLVEGLPSIEGRVICLDTDWGVISELSQENTASGVGSENLAYAIYTSGSTGKPKGVMIQHQSLVNLALTMIVEYELSERDRLLQFASISFDGAVEEIYSSLLCGGTLVIPNDEMWSSVSGFVQKCRDFQLTMLGLTTAYWHQLTLELAATEIVLPESLRLVSIGGEKVEPSAVKIWQKYVGSYPQLINAYGPSEGTVETTMYKFAESTSAVLPLLDISIGSPIANVQTYILDNNHQPVPIGVPGELHIAGAGLARGYLNRPELTAEKFIRNPFGKGKLYKTGDLARYLPDGNIEFLGRIDNQVKIRGFRIELGEIESVLATHSQVQQTAVIARVDNQGNKSLVAYVGSQDQSLNSRELRNYLLAKLPEYMVPSAFVFLETLPLTTNGKIDRKALSVRKIELTRSEEYVTPQTPVEQTLATIWQNVLGVEKISINDNFFEVGGDSILSIQVVSRAQQAGVKITPKQIFQHQTIAQLAMVAQTSTSVLADQGIVTGEVPLTPIQQWFFEQNWSEFHHFNQSVMLELPNNLQPDLLSQVIGKLFSHHDALRLRFIPTDTGWQQVNQGLDETVPLQVFDLSHLAPPEQIATIEQIANTQQASLNLSQGPLMVAALFHLKPQQNNRLLIIIHHLAVDGVSWRILLSDIQSAYQQLARGETIKLPPKTTAFRDWAIPLQEYARSTQLKQELDYWQNLPWAEVTQYPGDKEVEPACNTVASQRHISATLSVKQTRALLKEVPSAYNSQINDLLLTALVITLNRWTGNSTILIDLEGHGREQLWSDLDLSRTVGWFTSLFPVLLQKPQGNELGVAIKSIKEQLRAIPAKGIGYGILRYLSNSEEIRHQLEILPRAQISFNYLGQFDQSQSSGNCWKLLAPESTGENSSPTGVRTHLIDINALVIEGQFQVTWTYSSSIHQRATIEWLSSEYIKALEQLIEHCLSPSAGGYTPSDFPLAKLTQTEIDKLLKLYEIEDIYPMTQMQQLMWSISNNITGKIGVYHVQDSLHLEDSSFSLTAFKTALNLIVQKHPIFRTVFVTEQLDLPLQIVQKNITPLIKQLDLTHLSRSEQESHINKIYQEELQNPFTTNNQDRLLVRFWIILRTPTTFNLIISLHHTIIDGWSYIEFLKQLFDLYEACKNDSNLILQPAKNVYKEFVYLEREIINSLEAADFWHFYLSKHPGIQELKPKGQKSTVNSNDFSISTKETLKLDEETNSGLQSLAKQLKVSQKAIFLSAYLDLLKNSSLSETMTVGVVSNGRSEKLSEPLTSLGLFWNMIPFCHPLIDNKLQQIKSVHKILNNVDEYSNYPLTKILDREQKTELFWATFNFIQFHHAKTLISKHNLKLIDFKGHDRYHFPLNLTIVSSPFDEREVNTSIEYDRLYFTDVDIQLMLNSYIDLLNKLLPRNNYTI
ncbi:MAG: amino acid adenylation domain-containing protein [Xenococcaceae cyanobacterium]